MLAHFSLFSGIGGIDLAAEWAGFRTVGFVEQADYPVKVLQRHWPGVPVWRDVRDVTAESVRDAGIGPITLLSGGFPCQPFSLAGKRKGKGDDRYLWPEMSRVIEELRPTWVLGENVAGFISLALDDVLSDLEAQGYEARTFVLPACAVGAPHRRDRVFIVAHAQGQQDWRLQHSGVQPHIGAKGKDVAHTDRARRNGRQGEQEFQLRSRGEADFGVVGEDAADAASERLEGVEWQEPEGRGVRFANGSKDVAYAEGEFGRRCGETRAGRPGPPDGGWWGAEPRVGRVANGIPHRVHRLRALGNAVVPQQVYPILKAMADWERLARNPAIAPSTYPGAILAPSPMG